MDEKQLQFLFDQYGSKAGFADFAEFKGLMADSSARKVFFDNSNKDLGFKDYGEFESLLGFKKKDGGEISSPSVESPLPSPSVGIDPVEIQKRYERVGKGRTYLNDLIDKKRTELPDFAPMATDFMRSAAQFNEAGRKVERTNLVYDFLDKNFDVNTNDNTRDAFISSQYAGTYFSESPDLKYEYDKSDMKSVLTPRQFTGLKSLSFGKQSEYGQAIKKLSDPNVDAAEKEVIKLELDKIGVGIDKDAASAMVSQGVNTDLATQIFSKAKADEPLIEESLRNVDYQNPYSLRTFKNVIKGATERGYLVGERADLVTATAEETGIDVDRLAYLQGELKNSKASKAYEQFSENPSFENFKKAPIGIMLELGLESLTALYTHGASRMAAGAATGAAVGSVLPGAGTAAGASYGTISGMGLASLNLEYSSSILEGLDALGVNTSDPEALRSAFASEETMSKLKRTAYAKSIPVAIFDMLSAGIAGKIVTKPAKTVLGKVAGGVAEMGVQAGAGMAGEAFSQLAAEGKIYAPNAVLLEGLGELGPGVIEVAYGSMVESAKRNKPIAKADVVNVVSSGQQETVRQNVDAEVKAGTMSPEQASVVKEEIAKTEVSVAKIPDDLSVDAKAQIVELIEKKSELTAKAKTLDDAFKRDVESQIADVDQQIIQITQNDRNATVQSQVEQQAGPAEGGVQERPGVDGGQQEVGQGAGQQGQAPVTQPDTGDRVLGGQAEVDLAGELRGELRQDFQPIIDRAAQSLQASNIQFEVVDDAEFTSRAGQSAEGAFMTVGNDGKILLNRQKMEQADPGVIIWHESAHPVMNIVRNTNKPLYDRMVTGLKQVAQKSPELQRAIEFGKQYGAKLREAGRGDAEAIALEDDESIVESIAMIAADDKLMASLPTSIKQTLIDFVNYVAKALGIKARVTNTASADFRRTAQQIATALKEGRDITEIVGAENVGEIDNRLSEGITDIDGNPVDNSVAQFKVSGFKALVNGITFRYLKDSDRYNQLKADGFITEDKKISDFGDGLAMLHAPDHAFSGEMVKDEEVIVSGKGGVFYPLMFHDLGYFWAATKNSARSMAKKLNKLREDSPNKKMRLVLVSAREEKVLSSTTASSSVLSILLSKAFDRRAKITRDQVVESYRSAIESMKKEAAEKGERANFVFSGTAADFAKTLPSISKSDSRTAFENKMNGWFSADNSNFDQRKVLNEYALGSIAKLITDSEAIDQVFEFFSGVSGRELKSTGRRLSKTNLVSGFSNLLTEPMLKGVATTGDAYAVIELDADVEAVLSKDHESYPYALKSKDPSKKVVVHILQDRKSWTSFTVDPDTGSIVTKDRMNKVMDTKSGVSRPVQFNFQPQLSIGNRQAIIDKAKADGTYLRAPNGQPTNLSEDQWTTVRTPEFKNWFGDWENDPANASKVVDRNGEPMVVYHGSDRSFDTFMAGKAEGWGEGMYFASEESDTAEFGGIVYPVFLNIRNPINESNINKIGDDVVRTKVWEDESKRRRKWDEEEGVSELDYRDELEENVNLANKAWRELGYDGIMFFGSNNINGFEIVTFSPNQIKSATSNVGTFSTTDARIQFSAGPRAESRVEFKLVAFVLRKKAEGYTDQQIAVAINSALPSMAPQDIARLIQDPQKYLTDAFPGFTPEQHSNLFERAKVANIFRSAPQTNIHPFFRSLRVDPDVIKQYYERTKTKKEVVDEWLKSVFAKGFKPSRGLERWMAQAKEFANGAMNLEIANAHATIKELESTAAKIGFEDWDLFRQAMVDTGKMSGTSQLALPSPIPPSVTRLPLEIQPYVMMMRDQIDGLTSRLIAGGYVTPEQAIALQNNIGQYVNRAYRLFSEVGWKPDAKMKNAAIDFLTNQEYARLLQEFYDKNATPSTGQAAISGGPTVGGLANIPYDQLMEQAAKNAAVQVERIISKKTNPYFGDAKIESRSIGILKQRKEIPVEIRRLMGEYTDPGVVFMMTVVKQSALLASSQYLKDLRTRGLGTVFFEANDPNIPVTHSAQIASEGSSVLEPLNGLYTTPEIAEALGYIEPTYNWAMQIWMKGVGMVRMGKTVLSPVTQIVNFVGNFGFAVLNGLLFTKAGRPFGAAMGEAWEYAKGQYATKKDFSEVTQKMIKLGLVGQSIDANAISEAFSSGDMFEVALDVALTSDGVFKKIRKSRIRPIKFFEDLYRMGDDLWKVYAYISEREAYSSAKYKKKYADLTTEEQDIVDAEASERVKRTWPTFSRMFPIIRTLNKIVPLLGDFTGFQAESIRNPINIVQIALQDLKDPDLQASGARRMAAFTAYIGIQTAVTAAIPIMLGYGAKGLIGKLINDDDEEEKKWALDEACPPHMYHHDKVAVQSEKSPHILTVISMNANNPINWTQLAVNAYFDGTNDMSAGALAAVFEIGSRFLGLGMTTEAMFDVQYNINSSKGKNIYIGGKENEGGDSEGEKLMKSLDYVWDKLQPSAVKLYDRWSTTNNPGMEASAAFGFRTYEIDLHKSFSTHMSRASKTLTDIDDEYKKAAMFNKEATEEMKEEAANKANEKKMEVVHKLNRLYRAYTKLGADPKVMRQIVLKRSAVKMTGMDDKTKAGITTGNIKPNFY